MKYPIQQLSVILFASLLSGTALSIEESKFSKAQIPGDFVLKAEKGNWNWGMAPIYDEDGLLHVFNSVIPTNGSWIKTSKIAHYTAEKPEGPYTFVGDVFVSDSASYHNPQISKVDDTYVLVFLLNKHTVDGSKQEVGLATATSLAGPWSESKLNPVIPASGVMRGQKIVHASNPTFVATAEGKFRIYYKSMTDKLPTKKAFFLIPPG